MTAFPALVPFATQELLPDPAGRADGETYMGGDLTVSRGVVFHVNAGNGDPRGWWSNPGNHSVASAHIQIMKTGEIRQIIPLNRVAWAEVAGNGEWHSVETEGFPSEALTDPQFESFAKLLAWGHGACGWPLQATDDPHGYGLGTHQMGGAAWGGHACPGPVRAGQRPALLARAQQLLGGSPQPAPPPAPAGVGFVGAGMPAWPLDVHPRDYLGSEFGPNAEHGGNPKWDSLAIRMAIKSIQQLWVAAGLVPGQSPASWRTTGWCDGVWDPKYSDSVCQAWFQRFRNSQPIHNQVWSDDYAFMRTQNF